MSDDERAIRQLVETWMAATRAGDLATVLGLMSDDVLFMVAGKEPFGKEAFKAGSHELKNIEIDGSSEIQEIRALGDWAYMRNYLTLTMTPRDGGKPTRRSGPVLSILRKNAAGRWQLVRDANLLTADT